MDALLLHSPAQLPAHLKSLRKTGSPKLSSPNDWELASHASQISKGTPRRSPLLSS
jgi:hypothetical protein